MGLAATFLCVLFAHGEELAKFSQEGYRSAFYRSPTPPFAEHASTIDTAALQALLQQNPKPLLIDVYGRTFLNGRFVEDETHANLPGSLWLANTGLAELAPSWQTYFAEHLTRITDGNFSRPLVFYCRSDCWLSWNAVKRAHALGYLRLYWYRDGVDAWQQAGLPLVPATPAPFNE
nr:PQQ-dependent catabolism-associated CXXCW motif protein [Ventosimonas gracilis]